MMNIVCDFRRWIQAVFHLSNGLTSSRTESTVEVELFRGNGKSDFLFGNLDLVRQSEENNAKELANDFEVDMSEGMAFEMFGMSHSSREVKIPSR